MTAAKKSILAGALIAMGALFSLSVAQRGAIAQGVCFSVGLFGVLVTGARLFTGSMLKIQAVWDAQRPFFGLLREWAGIWALNALGAATIALCAALMGYDAGAVAAAKAAMPWDALLIRAALCNVLVCLAVYADRHAYNIIDTLAACVLPVACFVACGYEHSVADMLYMPLGWMGGAVSALDCVRVVGVATIGNVIGGCAFARLVWEGDNE